MRLSGIHHITLICSDMERTAEFYSSVLGLRLVKRTVNFDDPTTKHFYFGDERGNPGTLITFFEYPDGAPGGLGVGVTHHLAFLVEDEEQQGRWRERLLADGRGPGFAVDEDPQHLGERMIVPQELRVRAL